MGLKEDILDEITKDYAKQMDWEIVADCLVSVGWTNVKLNRFHSNEEAIDINNWLEQNCTDEWKNLSTRYIFKKKKDAEWFILRWQ
jgi:hypothetical protein